jgi:hypothetical protein
MATENCLYICIYLIFSFERDMYKLLLFWQMKYTERTLLYSCVIECYNTNALVMILMWYRVLQK